MACAFAAGGRQAIVFIEDKNEPKDISTTSEGIYAYCDANLETPRGLAKAIRLVDSRCFDTLMFATHADDDEDDHAEVNKSRYLTYGKHHVEVIKAAAFSAIRFSRAIKVA